MSPRLTPLPPGEWPPEMRDALKGIPYPFEHAEAGMTLDRFVFSIDPTNEIPAAEQVATAAVTAHDTPAGSCQRRPVSRAGAARPAA